MTPNIKKDIAPRIVLYCIIDESIFYIMLDEADDTRPGVIIFDEHCCEYIM
jgi:hypothetical protein